MGRPKRTSLAGKKSQRSGGEMIAVVAHMNRNYVEGSIKGHFVRMLCDTGAGVSCLALSFLKSIGISNKDLKQSHTCNRVRGVGGEIHEVIGSVNLSISIGSFKTTQHFHVFNYLYTPVILGYDFLNSNCAKIDTGNSTLVLGNGLVSVCLATKTCRETRVARSLKFAVIPPRSQCNIPLRVKKIQEGTVVLLEPATQLRQCLNLAGAQTLVTVHNGKVNYLVMNPTNTTVYIRAGYVVATTAKINNADVRSLGDNDPHVGLASADSQGDVMTAGHSALSDSDLLDRASQLGLDLHNANLTEEQKKQLLLLIGEYRDVFATKMSELGRTDIYQHKIDTGDAKPVRQRFYRQSAEAKKEIEKHIIEMLENDIIEPSTSEWHFPVVIVGKKDGSSRFVVDYRKLNQVTRPMSFPIPRLEDVFDTIGQNKPKFYTALDLASGFFQIPLDPETKHKSAFITPQGLYSFKVLPFGLHNSPSSFQMVLSEVLRGINWKFGLVYIDDILLFSESFEEHLDHIKQVFERFRKANLTLKPSKCNFAQESVLYLGHKISTKGIEVDPAKTEAIRGFPTPKSPQEVRSFLGMANFYRKFIKGYSQIALPLNLLLRKDAKFQWTEAGQLAFDTLKDRLITPPVLKLPEMQKHFSISTDASGESIGYVLEQEDEKGNTRPIAYGGRALRGSELAWSISEKECLAVVEAVKVYHPYLANGHFDIYTDHIALKWLQNTKNITGRLARWSLFLQGYDFTIHHRPGKANKVADALSRREYKCKDLDRGVTEAVPVLTIDTDVGLSSNWIKCDFTYSHMDNKQSSDTESEVAECDMLIAPVTDLRTMQRNCKDCSPMIRNLESGELPETQRMARRIVLEADSYVLLDGVLYHLYYRRAKGLPKAERLVQQLVVPNELRAEALQSYHDSFAGGGHQGFERTYHSLRNKYYWPHMYSDVHDHVQSCIECQKAKSRPSIAKAPLVPLPVGDIFERLHLDFLGPLTPSKENYKHVLVVTDSFTKWCEAIPTKTQKAEEVAEVLYREIFTRYGAPKVLVSDRGRNFMSGLVNALCSLFDIKRVHTSSYHRQTNSSAERWMSVIAQAIRTSCRPDQKDWPSLLPGIMMAYRATPSTQSTQYSPYFMLFGREMKLPFDVEWIPKQNLGNLAQHHLTHILRNLEEARKIATSNIEKAKDTYKKYNDQKVKEPTYEPGDKVWLYNPKVPVGLSRKFHRKWTGPFYITLKGPNYTVKLRACSDNSEVKSMIHCNRLKPYFDPDDRLVQPHRPVLPCDDDADDQPGGPQSEDTEDNATGNDTANADTRDNNPDRHLTIRDADNQWHTIEKIIACKRQQGRMFYRVKWAETGSNEWVPTENVTECSKRDFHVGRTASGKKRKRPLGKNKFFERPG